MDGVLKKGVVLLLVLFLGWLLFTDPGGLAQLAEDAGTGLWSMLVDLFEALFDFIGALGE